MQDIEAMLAEAERFEALQRAATPGPWEAINCGSPNCWCKAIQIVGTKNGELSGYVIQSGCAATVDADFIAHARNTTLPVMVRELVSQLGELGREVVELRLKLGLQEVQ